MILDIDFPDNLYTSMLLEQRDIPCLAKVSNEFRLIFQEPLPIKAEGGVNEWTHENLDSRVPAGAGGQYTHYKNGLVTLERETKNTYKIISLSLFALGVGWCSVISNGEYVEPYQFCDDNDDDPDYVPN